MLRQELREVIKGPYWEDIITAQTIIIQGTLLIPGITNKLCCLGRSIVQHLIQA